MVTHDAKPVTAKQRAERRADGFEAARFHPHLVTPHLVLLLFSGGFQSDLVSNKSKFTAKLPSTKSRGAARAFFLLLSCNGLKFAKLLTLHRSSECHVGSRRGVNVGRSGMSRRGKKQQQNM